MTLKYIYFSCHTKTDPRLKHVVFIADSVDFYNQVILQWLFSHTEHVEV